MVQAKCIEKIRDKNNNIIGYKIVDKNKNAVAVKSDRLKEVIRSGQLEVINLALTSDNRIIDKKPDIPSKSIPTHSKSNINAEVILVKVNALGYTITTFDTDCGHKCYLASSPDNSNHILIIPDDVKHIHPKLNSFNAINERFYYPMSEINGTLKVIGGKGLDSTRYMFNDCKVQSLDLSSFDTSNVTNMNSMFEWCKAQSIDLRSFDTRNSSAS